MCSAPAREQRLIHVVPPMHHADDLHDGLLPLHIEGPREVHEGSLIHVLVEPDPTLQHKLRVRWSERVHVWALHQLQRAPEEVVRHIVLADPPVDG